MKVQIEWYIEHGKMYYRVMAINPLHMLRGGFENTYAAREWALGRGYFIVREIRL